MLTAQGFLLAGLLEHLQTLLTERSPILYQVDDVLDLEENLEAVEPHNLVAACVRR